VGGRRRLWTLGESAGEGVGKARVGSKDGDAAQRKWGRRHRREGGWVNEQREDREGLAN